MSMITLQSASQSEVTILTNHFIDEYMPRANGEFVKVYVYLVRLLSDAPASFSLEAMADRLLCTERDICRALKYWEKEGLMHLHSGPDKKLSGIVLSREENSVPDTAPQKPLPVNTVPESAAAVSPAPVPAPAPEKAPKTPSSGRLTPDRVQELKQNEEIVQLLYITEQYLGKTLSPTEIQKLLFFYDELHMSGELVEYLIEYCVSHGHKSIRYIETVALAWAQEGITTVQMAKESSSRYSKEYYTILKSMGISGRNPVENEIALMDVWMKDYGFDLPIIQEACSRTVLQTGQPSFQYTDKILSGWKKKGAKSLTDIQALDEEHKKKRREKAAPRTPAPQNTNRFNNFPQREYDFAEYEKRLLNP